MVRSMSNRSSGVKFEYELCQLLSEHGWWSHDMTQNQTGQPADVIAVKNDIAVLIDCKICKRNYFSLSRVEPNQEAAMKHWGECGNLYCFFALKLSDGSIYMIPDAMVWFYMDDEKKTIINEDDITDYGMDIDTWLTVYEGD